MKLFKKILLTGVILFASQFLFAGNDYVTIISKGAQQEDLIISINGNEFEERNFDLPRRESSWNYNPVINTIKSFEDKGYKLLNSNVTIAGNGGIITYFILVREN